MNTVNRSKRRRCAERSQATFTAIFILAIAMCLGGCAPGFADPPAGEARAARQLPSAKAIEAAKLQIQRVFAADISGSKSIVAKLALAKKFTAVAGEDADAANRFVLLSIGLDFANAAGSYTAAESAIKLLESDFAVNGKVLRSNALDSALKLASGEELGVAIDRALELAAVALAAGDVQASAALGKQTSVAARRGKDRPRQQHAAQLLAEVKTRQRDVEKLEVWLGKLDADPDDAEALERVGAFYCFEREDWEHGLPILARIRSSDLGRLASLDLNAGPDPKTRLDVADGWTAYAQGKQKAVQSACLRRAQAHYEEVAPTLTGLAKAKVGEALNAISKSLGDDLTNWIVIFRSDEPKLWNTRSDAGFASFAMPVNALPSGVRFVRLRRASNEQVILPITKHQLASTFQEGRYGWSGEGKESHGDALLGVFDSQPPVPRMNGKVAIAHILNSKPDAIYTGWGFGHLQLSGTLQDFCWHGPPLKPEVLEIAVLYRDLNAKELPFLLR